jgi:mannose-P-dolichol utilization defect protein 1
VVNLNFSNVPCLKLAVSKCLGLAIVVGSSLVKLPQVGMFVHL